MLKVNLTINLSGEDIDISYDEGKKLFQELAKLYVPFNGQQEVSPFDDFEDSYSTAGSCGTANDIPKFEASDELAKQRSATPSTQSCGCSDTTSFPKDSNGYCTSTSFEDSKGDGGADDDCSNGPISVSSASDVDNAHLGSKITTSSADTVSDSILDIDMSDPEQAKKLDADIAKRMKKMKELVSEENQTNK